VTDEPGAPARSVIIEADGGARGNPGPAGYGAVVLDAESGTVLAERSEFLGVTTNNVAEYRGLIAGLEAAAELGAQAVHVRMDSKLVVEQMAGNWQVKNAALRDLARTAVALRASFHDVTFEWIPRERNTRADRLANEAMDSGTGVVPRPERGKASPAVAATPVGSAWAPVDGEGTRLVLVRHGSTEHSLERRFSGRNELPLSEIGEQQATRLAMRARQWSPDVIVSSPLLRCTQTAEAIAERVGMPVEVLTDLVEIDFGAWEGLTMAEAAATDADALTAWYEKPDTAPPGGESFEAAARRVLRARDALLGMHRGQTVVVVTHVTPIKLLVQDALDAPRIALFRLHLDPGSVSVVDYFPKGRCSVRLVNDTGHLAD
jgi:probable phosphoglycerate mutase